MNGNQTTVLDGGKGVDLIVSDNTEIQLAMPSYDIRNTPTGKGVFSGFADWGFFRVKQRVASSPSSADLWERPAESQRRFRGFVSGPAKSIGITIPPTLLATATDVIE
jgi:hypothetical protein